MTRARFLYQLCEQLNVTHLIVAQVQKYFIEILLVVGAHLQSCRISFFISRISEIDNR